MKFICQKKKVSEDYHNMQTFGEHLEVLRKMLFKTCILSFAIAIVIFFLKDQVFSLILAPCSSDFITYDLINKICFFLGSNDKIHYAPIELIATGLSSQFLAHMSLSLYLGILLSSPFILYELFRFISPALYDNERKYSVNVVTTSYLLFLIGIIVSYFILFPLSCRFLESYSVSEDVKTMVTLDSYISTFVSLTLLMGLVFQLPIISFFLAKMGVITHSIMTNYRKHAFILILIVAAIITPPDVMTLILVSFPLYILYEVSILVVKFSDR